MKSLQEKVFEYVKNEYGVSPEFLWQKYPDFAVLRCEQTKKWFGILMKVKCKKLGIKNDGEVDILNIKLPVDGVDFLLQQKGFLPAYHMNKQHWISVLLDGTVDFKLVCELLDQSYFAVGNKVKQKRG